ncbi:MAG: tetratricopeptide repeat protein [Myxococcota bacterium]
MGHRRRGHRLWAAALLVAVLGCGDERPAHRAAARFSGATFDPLETVARPPDAGPHNTIAPEVVETDEGPIRRFVSYSEVYDVDRLYNSMEGPASVLRVPLRQESAEPELLWVKGVYVEVVDERGEPADQEFMCHVVGGIDPSSAHDKQFGFRTLDGRFATLSQGQVTKDYPTGYGVPVLSNEAIGFSSQVLNFNQPSGLHRVRHKIVTLYLRDSEAKIPMKAIKNSFAQVMVLVGGEPGDGYFGVRMPDPEVHGESCAVGVNASAVGATFDDLYGREFSGHWIVEPGRHTNQTLATHMMNVPDDTRIHTIDTHLHPFAESLELRDLTTQETIFRAEATMLEEGHGVRHVETFSSAEGIPVYADHEYAIVATYDNTSGEPQDAMASFYLGFHDPDFDPDALSDPAVQARIRQKRNERALPRSRSAVARDPADPVAQYRLGLNLYHLGELDEALVHLREAVRLDPDDLKMRHALTVAEGRLEAANAPFD